SSTRRTARMGRDSTCSRRRWWRGSRNRDSTSDTGSSSGDPAGRTSMTAKRETDPADDFLGALERRETALLAWGLADGSFSDAELDELAERFLTEEKLWGEFSSTDDLVKRAEDRRLLFP